MMGLRRSISPRACTPQPRGKPFPKPRNHARRPAAFGRGRLRITLLNRLDAPTSGLVLASRTEEGERRWYRAERIGNTDKLYLALIEGQPLYDFTVARRLDTDTRNKTRVRHTDDPDPVRHTDVTLLAPLTAGDVPGLVESDAPDAPLMLVGCRIRKARATRSGRILPPQGIR